MTEFKHPYKPLSKRRLQQLTKALDEDPPADGASPDEVYQLCREVLAIRTSIAVQRQNAQGNVVHWFPGSGTADYAGNKPGAKALCGQRGNTPGHISAEHTYQVTCETCLAEIAELTRQVQV